MIKVIIAGYRGRMGATAVQMVLGEVDFELAALFDPHSPEREAFGVPVFTNKADLAGVDADVWLDFTQPSAVFENTVFAIEQGFHPVIGTTGLTEDQIRELTLLSKEQSLGGLIAPNFALGAVLLMQFSKQAAKYFSDVEIIELHHDKKKDAPSGTAVKTAELIAKVRSPHLQGAADEEETLMGARGADFEGMHIHSVRLPGLIAHQEVIFGSVGEGLTLRHDSYDRASFMTGVALAIRQVMKETELAYGLENFLSL
jgi:4-hydroxy-tetrahydrodipicolinate reductase